MNDTVFEKDSLGELASAKGVQSSINHYDEAEYIKYNKNAGISSSSESSSNSIEVDNNLRKAMSTPTNKHLVPVTSDVEQSEKITASSSYGSMDTTETTSQNDNTLKLGDMSLDEKKVYTNLAKLNSFFLNNCSRDKINNLTKDEIDGLIDQDIEHVFANMYHAAKKSNKKITDVYEAKRDFLLHMYNSSIMDIELTKLNEEFMKMQKEFLDGSGLRYDILAPMIKERIENCEDAKVKNRLQQIHDAFMSSLTFEAFLPKSRRNKIVYHTENEKFNTRYEKEKAVFMDVLDKDNRTYIISSPRIEEDLAYVLSKEFPEGEMVKYVKPFLFTLYREINKDRKVSTTSAVFLIFFLSNVNAVMRDLDVSYSKQFINNLAAFMQKHYVIQ